MTREELIQGLQDWKMPQQWTNEAIRRRDDLQFAIWWYGRSTEADKPNPSWPSLDYVASKTGHAPRFMTSIDDALTLVPKSSETHQFGTTIYAYANGGGEARIWVRIRDDDAEGGWARGNVPGNPGLPANVGATPAIALCIAALKARMGEGK